MKFLSDEWFTKVDELKAEAGDLNIPENIASLVINVNVTDGDDSQELHMKGGDFVKGHSDDAPTTLTLASDLARKIFVEGDMQAGMQAFMSGEIKVEGDMSKLMELQMIQPSEEQKKLMKSIKDITE